MATPIRDFEFFRAGDYREQNRKLWRKDVEIKDFVDDFFEGRKQGKTVPILWNPESAHEVGNAAQVGIISDVFVKGNGIVSGNGHFMDEYLPLIKEQKAGSDSFAMYDSVSATFTPDQKKLKNIVLTGGGEAPFIKGLKHNWKSLFSDGEESLVIEFSSKKNEKEKNMSDLKFSQEYVDLEVIKAKEAREKELNIEFSEKLAEKDKEINDYEKRVEQLNKEIDEKDKKLLEFSEKQKQGEHQVIRDAIGRAVEAGKITPAEKDEKIEALIHFSENGKEEWVKRDLEKLEKAEPLVEFSGLSGNRGKVGADDDLDTYEIDISAQAEKAGEK